MRCQRRHTSTCATSAMSMPMAAAILLLAAAASNQHVSAFSSISIGASNPVGGGGTAAAPLIILAANRSPASTRLSMAADKPNSKNGAQKPPATTTPLTTAAEPPGLGGKSGWHPDVNSLKRNLVQEAVRAYKSELLELLGTPHGGKEYFQPTAAAVAGGGATPAAAAAATGANASANASPTSASASSSPLYANGSGSDAQQLYDEDRDGGKPVSYYKYGPGAAAYGRTYAGEWATRDELIEDKLAALVQANPVSTTTDSNLLEGSWEFVFSSTKASDIVDPSRFVLIRTEQGSKQANANGKKNKVSAASANKEAVGPVESRPWAIRSGQSENPLRSLTRKIYLEELKDDEDPYVVDTTSYMGGLWSVQRKYDVTALSRTALDLGLKEKDMKAFGLRIPLKKQKKKEGGASVAGGKVGDEYLGKAKVQVIYLDSDLCITTTERGMEGPLLVYTKREFWTAMRKSKFLLATAAWVWSKQSPLRIRQRIGRVLPFGRKSGQDASRLPGALIPGDQQAYTDEENRVMLQRTYADPSGSSRLMVLKMGEPLINADGTLREDLTDAWDGDSDPFVHLDPIERQKMMKGMTIEAIEAAGKAQRDANKRSGGRYRQNTPIDRSFKKKVNKERSFKKPQ